MMGGARKKGGGRDRSSTREKKKKRKHALTAHPRGGKTTDEPIATRENTLGISQEGERKVPLITRKKSAELSPQYMDQRGGKKKKTKYGSARIRRGEKNGC